MEKRGLATERGNINRVIQAYQAAVDLASVRKDRLALEQVQRRIDQADSWRVQAGWPEPERQRLRGWEERAGRVLTREDVTQWVQEVQIECARAKATEQEAWRAVQASKTGQATHDQLTGLVQQAQRAHQYQAAYEQARTTRQAVEAKRARWQAVLAPPWTPEEQAAQMAREQQPVPTRQVPPQPLSGWSGPTVTAAELAQYQAARPRESEQDRGYAR